MMQWLADGWRHLLDEQRKGNPGGPGSRRGGERPRRGAGPLCGSRGEFFVTPATHVVEDADRDKNQLWMVGGLGKIIELRAQHLLTNRNKEDVAVLRLRPEVAAELTEKTFLYLHHVNDDEDLRPAVFALYGYPQMWSKDNDRTFYRKGFHFQTYAYTGETSSFQHYDPKLHLLLEADGNEVVDKAGERLDFSYLDSNVQAPFPQELKGMSGCCVWKIGDRRRPFEEQSRDNAWLVGIETGVFGGKQCIKATRWAVALEVIFKQYPFLRRVFDLARP